MDLATRLQQVVPERTAQLSEYSRERIIQRIAANVQLIRPYKGEYKARWLLSEWSAPIWRTYAGRKTRLVDGTWKRTVDINWETMLPNRRLLTDPAYALLLQAVREAVYLDREGMGDGITPAVTSWRVFCIELAALCRWMILNEARFQPGAYAFRLLDQDGLRRLFAELGRDGWTSALCLTDRTLDAFHRGAFGVPIPPSLLDVAGDLPAEVVAKMRAWLSDTSEAYIKPQSRRFVSRRFIADLIAAPVISLRAASPRFNAVLRQFEPDLIDANGLLLPTGQSTKLPSHKTITVEQALRTPASTAPIKRAGTMMRSLLMVYRHIPESLPDPSALDIAEAKSVGLQSCTTDRHTMLMPLNTGLTFLNEAIRWVYAYGDAIVDYYLTVAARISTAGSARGYEQGSAGHLDLAREILQVVEIPEVLREAGFRFTALWRSRTNPSRGNSTDLRDMTLHECLGAWAGAATILIGLLKPSRDVEVGTLRDDCLIGDGPYWLDSELGKRIAREHRAMTRGKPIPSITARAIRQLQRLGAGLKAIFSETDSYKRECLFYLPVMSKFGIGAVPQDGEIDGYLDKFCDAVALPADALGRRWYIRIHEMRKYFLMLLVWAGRYDVLDAAREIAGHVDIKHLYAYIEREFGAELPRWEAEYAADRLRRFDETRIAQTGETGLNELYERVLTHFGAEYLELIPERAWCSYVEELRKQNEFRLQPYTITDESGSARLCVAFRSS
jgi:hypothetical protein